MARGTTKLGNQQFAALAFVERVLVMKSRDHGGKWWSRSAD
jgi:hypothetical protein